MKLKWAKIYWDPINYEWKTRKMRYHAKNIFKTIEGNRCVLGEGDVCNSGPAKFDKCWILISDPNYSYYFGGK